MATVPGQQPQGGIPTLLQGQQPPMQAQGQAPQGPPPQQQQQMQQPQQQQMQQPQGQQMQTAPSQWGGWQQGQQAAMYGNAGQQYGNDVSGTNNWGYGQNGANIGQNFANQVNVQGQEANNPNGMTNQAMQQMAANPNMTTAQMQAMISGTPYTPANGSSPAVAGTPSMGQAALNQLYQQQGASTGQLNDMNTWQMGAPSAAVPNAVNPYAAASPYAYANQANQGAATTSAVQGSYAGGPNNAMINKA